MNEHEQKKKDTYLRKLVANARAVISHQIGMPLGCERASKILNWLRRYSGPSYPIFDEYMKEVGFLPTGTERLYWNAEKLREQDEQLEKVNAQFRESIIDACQDIVRRYA